MSRHADNMLQIHPAISLLWYPSGQVSNDVMHEVQRIDIAICWCTQLHTFF